MSISRKWIAESTHASPLSTTANTQYGITTPENEDSTIDVFLMWQPIAGDPPVGPTAREVCKLGKKLLRYHGNQAQLQEITNGANLAEWWIAVHPAVVVKPGATIDEGATVASLVLDGEGEETEAIAIDTRTVASFVQPAVDSTVVITVYDIEEDFPAVGKRLFVSGGGWYEITARNDNAVTVKNLGLSGAIVTLAA